MTLYIDDPDFKLYLGNVERELDELEDESVHVVVTSPPYFGLRDYGTGRWEGGDPGCVHAGAVVGQVGNSPGHFSTLTTNGGKGPKPGDKFAPGTERDVYAERCPDCGAERIDEQVGLEESPYEYVDRMVEIFRGVRRVLRRDGTVWLNVGDTYAANRGYQVPDSKWKDVRNHMRREVPAGMKEKDLCLVPEMLALALRDDGWWIRQRIIWHKPNALPESVTDRPTTDFEHVWLLARSGTPQFWTHAWKPGTRRRPAADWRWLDRLSGELHEERPAGANAEERLESGAKRWRRVNLWRSHDYFYDGYAIREPAEWERWGDQVNRKDYRQGEHGASKIASLSKASIDAMNDGTRNARSVWSINTASYEGAHFAVFPGELPGRCIDAGSSAHGVCAECGAPWARRVARGRPVNDRAAQPRKITRVKLRQGAGGTLSSGTFHTSEEQGWTPTCRCDAPVKPAVILDVFMGSGTTAVEARKRGRHVIGIELSEDHARQCAERTQQQSLLTA